MEGSSASTRMVKGVYHYTLERYSLCKSFSRGQSVFSGHFTAGGHLWKLFVFPRGREEDSVVDDHVYIGCFISLRTESSGVRCVFQMKLLDQSGEGNNRISSCFHRRPLSVFTNKFVGFPYFIRRDLLDNSSYVKDDCLKIECTIGVLLPCETKILTPSIDAPQSDDVGVDFLAMLESAEGGFDVVFNVRGEKFHAHKLILSARSSVLARHLAESDQQEIVITGVEPHVFKALLYFIYSDALPEDKDGYALGPSASSTLEAKLLAAADEYDLRRLKSICESHLWRGISLARFAETLSLAERYNASALKHLCFKYAAHHYAALVESDSFAYLRENCPLLLNEMDDYISNISPNQG